MKAIQKLMENFIKKNMNVSIMSTGGSLLFACMPIEKEPVPEENELQNISIKQKKAA